MKKLSLSLFAGMLLSSTLSHGIVYRITQWEHPTIKTDGISQQLNFFHDRHRDLPDCNATSKQHADLKAREAHTFRIVEDMTDALAHYDLRVQEMLRNDISSSVVTDVLIKIDPAAKQHEPSVVVSPISGLYQLNNTRNVEWRQAFGLGNTPEERKMFEKIFNNDTRSILGEVAAYDDGPALNSYYQSIIADVLDRKPDLSGDELVKKIAPLVDARMMHTIYTNTDKPIIDVIAGGAHCQRLEPVLQELGYEQVADMYHPDVDPGANILIPVDISNKLA